MTIKQPIRNHKMATQIITDLPSCLIVGRRQSWLYAFNGIHQTCTRPFVENAANENVSNHIILCTVSFDHDLCLWHHCSRRFSLTSVTSEFRMATLSSIWCLSMQVSSKYNRRYRILQMLVDFCTQFGCSGLLFRCHNLLQQPTVSLTRLGLSSTLVLCWGCFTFDMPS